MTISFLTLAKGMVALLAVGMGFTYHLGWKHGWNDGFRLGSNGDLAGEDEEQQPTAKSAVKLLYVLGWHHGWDYGFRKGDQERYKNERKQR